MFPKHSSTWTRFFAVGLAAAAIAPATAAAAPAIEGQGVAAGGGPAMVATQDLRTPDRVDGGTGGNSTSGQQDYRAPDRADGGTNGTPARGQEYHAPGQVAQAPVWPEGPRPVEQAKPALAKAPVWPANPRSLVQANPAQSTGGDGVETSVLIALGGAALLALAGIGIASSTRVRTVFRHRMA